MMSNHEVQFLTQSLPRSYGHLPLPIEQHPQSLGEKRRSNQFFIRTKRLVGELPRALATGQVGKGNFRVAFVEFRRAEIAGEQQESRDEDKCWLHFLGAGGREVTGTNFWARSV